jgi:hypothetical protein
MAQAQAQVNVPVVPPPPAVAWARTPGNHNPNNLLDFGDPKDVKFYYKTVTWIAEKYDLNADKLFSYGQRIAEKIVACGLQRVTSVPIIVHGAGPVAAAIPTPFIKNYGTITMTQCQAHGANIMAAQDRCNH